MLIPNKINLYCRENKLDGAYEAYPVDPDSSQDNAKNWATENPYHLRVKGLINKKPLLFTIDNSELENIFITSLEKRGNGGRAYKVILQHNGENFLIDLREDTLMDVINNTGIEAGGKLNGSFCFVKKGSQLNLAREGSEFYKFALATDERNKRAPKKIPNKDLKPGYIYESADGKTKKVFLGFIYTITVSEGEVCLLRKNYIEHPPVKQLLFYDISYFNDNYEGSAIAFNNGHIDGLRIIEKKYDIDLQMHINSTNTIEDLNNYYIDIKKTHSLKIEGKKLLDTVIIEDIVSKLQRISELHYNLFKKNGYNKSSYYSGKLRQFELASTTLSGAKENVKNKTEQKWEKVY